MLLFSQPNQTRFSMEHAEGFVNLVKDAKKRIKEEDYRETKKRLDAGEKFFLVDVREDSEWARGHIPGAVHLGKGVIERDVEKTIPDKDATLVLYCGGGFRSALAADNLRKMRLHQRHLHGRRLARL